MIALDYWPFHSLEQLNLSQLDLWWEHCFLCTNSIDLFLKTSSSMVLMGGPGSSKSVAVAALKRIHKDRFLFLNYHSRYWPAGEHPFMPDQDHVAQIMALAATTIQQQLQTHPERFVRLDSFQHEFLFWLIEKYLNRRVLVALLRDIGRKINSPIEIPAPSPDIFTLYTKNSTEIRGQIDELVGIAQGFGYEKVVLLLDCNAFEISEQLDDLNQLFGLLDLMEHPNFIIRAALPKTGAVEAQVLEQSSGRVPFVRMTSTISDCQKLITNYLRLATDGEVEALKQMAMPAIIKRAEREIELLYGGPSPAGWLGWAETILHQWLTTKTKPLSDEDDLTLQFYQQHIRLRLGTQNPGVWRGPQFIPLEGQPFLVLQKLFEMRGRPDRDKLLDIAGSSVNLNTIVNRIKLHIEPMKGRNTNVYLHNTRESGYWLDEATIYFKK